MDQGRDESAEDEEVEALRARVAELEERVEERSVEPERLESHLERYVRRRQRRGHARGWGPYLVLLYGTVLTIAALYFLSGGWAILAMLVIAFSTLGLYVFMVLTGYVFKVLGFPGRLRERLFSR